ncbi:XamI family restriction endonuclease [Actinomadura sp. SCN-SB]|uniref:XamI family restriction endonuclease n=1 Tax=Actinomadura sp. SCN-SB TaxID=3373092 RepID=UPI003750EAAF
MSQVMPPVWTEPQLEDARCIAIDYFRQERMGEPLEKYLERFQEAREAIETILEMTTDLTRIREFAVDILSDRKLAETARYLSGPPVSKDDLETLASVTMAPTLMRKNPERATTLMSVILLGLDRERFPWLAEEREPLESETNIAIISTAAMQAMRNVETIRRNEGKDMQESRVKDFLRQECRLNEVPPRKIENLSKAPAVGEFCAECEVGSRKADVVVRLWDGRLMPIECKVSNSGTNSYKRINNDAAVKAVEWRKEFGTTNIVPTAILSGVFVLANLTYAQERGLSLLWAHDLSPLHDFIAATKP